MALVTATLGGVPLPLDPERVGWRATTKQSVTETVGGKVVQVFGTSISEVNIQGSYGTQGFTGEQAFLAQVKAWVAAQVGDLVAVQGQGIWNGSPLQFVFPFHNWILPVYIVKFWNPNPESYSSVYADPGVVNYHWALTLYVASNNASVTAADSTLDASLIQYMSRLAQYFGWFPNQAAGPVSVGQYPTLVPLTATTPGG
jgi:hypothetical protein